MKIFRSFWLLSAMAYAIIALGYHVKTPAINVFHSDASGYYAYLPAIFKHGDISFDKLGNEEQKNGIHTNYRIQKDSINVNKYTVGVSVLISPFYMIANLFEGNSFGNIHRLALVIASLFYAVLAFLLLSKILILLRLKSTSILLIALGTNLLYYTIAAPLMSHIYSFFLITLFAYSILRGVKEDSGKMLILSSISFALILLVRPVNGIVICFVPFLVTLVSENGFRSTWIMIRKNLPWISLCFFCVLFIQLILWKWQSGNWFIWSYEGEGFNWLSPSFVQVWFGFKKGLFIYAPVLILILPALYQLRKSNKISSLYFLLGFILISYVISSWWDWGYGDGFGQRAFIGFYGIITIVLAYTFKFTSIKLWLIRTIAVLTVLLSLMFNYQFYKRILHPNNMDFNKYMYAFFKFDNKFTNCFGSENAPVPYGRHQDLIHQSTVEYFDMTNNEYGGTVDIETGDLPIRVIFEAEKYAEAPIDYRQTYFVANGFDPSDSTTVYELLPFYEINYEAQKEWCVISGKINLQPAHHYRFYIWNKAHKNFKIRNLNIKVFQLKTD